MTGRLQWIGPHPCALSYASVRLAPVVRFPSPTAVLVLAIFFASIVLSSLAPILDRDHAPGHDFGTLSLANPAGAGAADGSGGDDAKCNHNCHLLQHFQGSVTRLATLAFEPWSGAYVSAVPDAPPQLFFDTHLRPPRAPFRTV